MKRMNCQWQLLILLRGVVKNSYMNVDAYRDMCRSGRRNLFKNSPLILIFLCSEKGMAAQGVQ